MRDDANVYFSCTLQSFGYIRLQISTHALHRHWCDLRLRFLLYKIVTSKTKDQPSRKSNVSFSRSTATGLQYVVDATENPEMAVETVDVKIATPGNCEG